MTTPLDLASFGGDTEPVEGVGTSHPGYNTEVLGWSTPAEVFDAAQPQSLTPA